MYDTLRIQTKAGVYLTSSLTECYLVVKNPRLKTALLDLNNYIMIKNDVYTGIEEFNMKFDSPFVNTFCIVIKQGIESGKTVQVLEDLSSQIRDIDNSMKEKLSEQIKSKLAINQLLIFIGLIATVLYGIMSSLASSLMKF